MTKRPVCAKCLTDHWPTCPVIGGSAATTTIYRPCTAFALCANAATLTLPHPVLGEFAACQRCADKLERIRGL